MIRIRTLTQKQSLKHFLKYRSIYKLSIGINSSKIDYFQVLQISKQATEQQIKSAFHIKAKQFHPDKNPSFQQKFKIINEAYRVLTDPIAKRQYEKSREMRKFEKEHKEHIQSVKEMNQDQVDRFSQLVKNNINYLNVKSKQATNNHISTNYDELKVKNSEKKQNQERTQQSSQRYAKYFVRFSGFLTSIILIEMVGKYMYRNRQEKSYSRQLHQK